MVITTSSFIKDVVIFLRNLLRTNITDPLSRSSGIGFVMTAFPKRNTEYPIITVRVVDSVSEKLGMQSELHQVSMVIEIEVFARNSKESDSLAQDAVNVLRSNQYGTDSTDVEEIHGFELTAMVPVIETQGDNTIHRKILTFNYRVIIGS